MALQLLGTIGRANQLGWLQGAGVGERARDQSLCPLTVLFTY